MRTELAVMCEVPSDGTKKEHRDLDNRFSNFMNRLKELSEEEGIRLMAPYISKSGKDSLYLDYEGIERMLFFGDRIGLGRICMTFSMGRTFRTITGKKRWILLIVDGKKEGIVDFIIKRTKVAEDDILIINISDGEQLFCDPKVIVRRIISQ